MYIRHCYVPTSYRIVSYRTVPYRSSSFLTVPYRSLPFLTVVPYLGMVPTIPMYTSYGDTYTQIPTARYFRSRENLFILDREVWYCTKA
jgi:hypothetical protein